MERLCTSVVVAVVLAADAMFVACFVNITQSTDTG
jgi:hypothetical protein